VATGARRLRLVIGAATVLAAVTSCSSWTDPLDVTIRNRTPTPLAGLELVTGDGARTAVPTVLPGGSVSVRPRLGTGEDSLALVDGDGRRHILLGYYEGDPGGEVIVTVQTVSREGLFGRVLDRSRYAPAGDQPLEPAAR
jgi:hypothetical protein